MKSCPECGFRMQDAENRCSDCGADYLEAVVNDIAGSGADSRLMLSNLEGGLARLDTVSLPTVAETVRKMLPVLCAGAVLFCLLAGVVTGANLFYLLAVVALIPLVMALMARIKGRHRLSAGEVVVRAAARIFEEDVYAVRERFAGQADVMARVDAMELRLNEALAEQVAAHARNSRKVAVIATLALLLCCAGVGMLAVRNHAVRKAEVAYAMQPEWIKLRDRYLAVAGENEVGDKELRLEVVRAMLDAGESPAVEEFFFTHSQGNMGDADCALLIILHYKNKKNTAALGTFTDKVKLRYDSDTQKVKSLK